jgi:Sugar (and other) transporter
MPPLTGTGTTCNLVIISFGFGIMANDSTFKSYNSTETTNQIGNVTTIQMNCSSGTHRDDHRSMDDDNCVNLNSGSDNNVIRSREDDTIMTSNLNSNLETVTTQQDDGDDKCCQSDVIGNRSTTTDDHDHSTTPPPESDVWQVAASVAGNVLEWYDFSVFGYLSDILGEVFFPPNQVGGTKSQTMESFFVFGLAFLLRPIGGLLFGYIGDYYGRKKALVISIFVMAFPTFIMGTLPGYNQIGKWAIFFLILVRLLQGLSVGGQLVSSLVYLLENQNPDYWGFYGSFAMATAIL